MDRRSKEIMMDWWNDLPKWKWIPVGVAAAFILYGLSQWLG